MVTKRLQPQWFELGDPAAIREATADGIPTSYIMVMPEGTYQHPEYGTLNFSRDELQIFKKHFDDRVRKIDIALDVDHRANKGDSRATGWIDDLEFREANGSFPAGLWSCTKWTPYGAEFIHNREYRYFSPEFGDYTDESTGRKFKNVLIGGALTNRPFLKVMPAVTLSEPQRRKITKLAQSGKSIRQIAAIAQLSEKEVKTFMATKKTDGAANTPLLKQAQKRPTAPKPSDTEDYEPDDIDDATAFEEEDEDEAEQYDDSEDEDEDEAEAAEPDDDDGGPPSNHPEPDADNRKMARKGSSKASSSRGGKRMSEPETEHVSLAEFKRVQRQAIEQQRELAEVRFRVYEQDIEKMLSAWQKGKTISYEYGTTKILSEAAVKRAKVGTRQGRVAITPKFARKFRDFMLEDGYRLSEDRRAAVIDLIQSAISDSAFVDLSQRGGSFDMDAPRGGPVSPRNRRSKPEEVGADVVALAEQISTERNNKSLAELDPDERLHIMMLAEQQAEQEAN